MKKVFSLFALLFTSHLITLTAQQVDLPRPSPKASVGYTIGLTDVMVTYGAPAVKGRTIWGEVVPYGQIWRGGANEATTVEFSTDVNMEGQTLKAGKYALFFIPGESEWTVILNKNYDQWGAYKYNEDEDAIRFTVEPKMNEGLQERLMYSIHDMKMDMGYIKLSWEKMRLYMRFKSEVMDQAISNVLKASETTAPERRWIVFAMGAEFLVDNEGNLDQALDWAKKSTDQFSTCWNWYVRAKIEAKKGDMVNAVASGSKSIELGMADDTDEYYKEHHNEIMLATQEWATKMN